MNNPYRYVDPDGRSAIAATLSPLLVTPIPGARIVYGVAVAGSTAYASYKTYKTWQYLNEGNDKEADASEKVNGNAKSSTKAQHGYDIYDDNGNVVKIGVSGGRVRKDGKSSRAEKQVRDWNKEVGYDKYSSKIKKNISEGSGARGKILNWEKSNADKNRATLDPTRHQRP